MAIAQTRADQRLSTSVGVVFGRQVIHEDDAAVFVGDGCDGTQPVEERPEFILVNHSLPRPCLSSQIPAPAAANTVRPAAAVMTVFFSIPGDAPCDRVYDIEFTNGIVGAGVVPISNRAAVFNESLPVQTKDGCLVVGGLAEFLRGDCNTDQIVDIADPAATMSYLFLNVYHPNCMDACDSNDDGVVDLADVMCTLRFLFKLGPVLPPPGPFTPGLDPTPDIYGLDLGCEDGDQCDGP